MRFIEWVGIQRRHKKYHEIAADLGVHPSYLGHIKNGKFSISKKFAEKVEEVSGGLCKKEEIVFEKITEDEWKKYVQEDEGVDEEAVEASPGRPDEVRGEQEQVTIESAELPDNNVDLSIRLPEADEDFYVSGAAILEANGCKDVPPEDQYARLTKSLL